MVTSAKGFVYQQQQYFVACALFLRSSCQREPPARAGFFFMRAFCSCVIIVPAGLLLVRWSCDPLARAGHLPLRASCSRGFLARAAKKHVEADRLFVRPCRSRWLLVCSGFLSVRACCFCVVRAILLPARATCLCGLPVRAACARASHLPVRASCS